MGEQVEDCLHHIELGKVAGTGCHCHWSMWVASSPHKPPPDLQAAQTQLTQKAELRLKCRDMKVKTPSSADEGSYDVAAPSQSSTVAKTCLRWSHPCPVCQCVL